MLAICDKVSVQVKPAVVEEDEEAQKQMAVFSLALAATVDESSIARAAIQVWSCVCGSMCTWGCTFDACATTLLALC